VGIFIVLQAVAAPATFAQSGDGHAAAVDPDQQRAARSLFDAGTIAFRQLRYEDALENFLQAHKLTRDPVLLFNIGLAYERLYRLPEAQKAFEDYLTALPNARNRAAVEDRIRAVREQNPQNQPEPAQPEPTPEPVVEPVPDAPPPPPPPDDRGLRVLPKWAFFSGVGATAVLGGVTIWSGVDTLSVKDKYDDDPSSKLKHKGEKAQLRTNVLIGATGLFAAATAVVGVFFTDWKGKSRDAEVSPQAKIAPWIDGSSAGLGVSGSF
jgi:tetratricopeptide (TPR) repeat protein